MRRRDRGTFLGFVAVLCALAAAALGAFGPRGARAQAPPGNGAWVIVDGDAAGIQFLARPVEWFRLDGQLSTNLEGEVLLFPAIGSGTGWALKDRRGHRIAVTRVSALAGWQQAASAAVMDLLGARAARSNAALRQAAGDLATSRQRASVAIASDGASAPPEGVLHTLDAAIAAVDEALRFGDGAPSAAVRTALDRTREALTELPRRPPPPEPVIAVDRTLLSFEDLCVGQSTQLSFVLSNTSQTQAQAITSSLDNEDGAYVLTQPIPSSLAAGASVTITVIFKPNQEGDAHGRVSIKDTTSGDEESVSLSGTGEAMFALQPNDLDFGSVAVGQTKDLTFNIVSCTDKTVSLKVSTPTSGEFKIVVPPGAPATLEPHKSAPVTIRFEPAAAGKQYGAQIKVVGTAEGVKGKHKRFDVVFGKSPLVIGTDPGKLSFGTVPLNTPKTLTLTLTNNSAQAQTVHFNTSGVDGTFFHFSETGPFTLAPGESHPVTVTFEATGKCDHNDTLVLTGDGFAKEKIPITAVSK